MRIYGTLKELVEVWFRKDTYNVKLKPNAGTYTADTTISLPPKLSSTDTLVAETTTQTLTNKTLTTPVISQISNTGTLTLPTSTDTVVGRATTDTLTNKSISGSANTLTNIPSSALGSTTGSGAVVLATSPTLVTPALGTPSSATLTNATGLPISTGVSGLASGVAAFLGTPSSANLASAVTDETGTGALVFANAPTLIAPALGTPASGVLTNATGLPLTTGVTGTLPIGNGGTGQTTANAALNALLPSQTGNSGKGLVTDGTNTSWVATPSNTLSQFNMDIGDSGNNRTAVNTSRIGDIQGYAQSAIVTISNGTNAVVTHTGHGLRGGDKVYFTTTGSLPTGLSINTTYYVYEINANSYSLCTSLVNVVTATRIPTSSVGSGTHTVFYGGLQLNTRLLCTYKQSTGNITGTSITTDTDIGTRDSSLSAITIARTSIYKVRIQASASGTTTSGQNIQLRIKITKNGTQIGGRSVAMSHADGDRAFVNCSTEYIGAFTVGDVIRFVVENYDNNITPGSLGGGTMESGVFYVEELPITTLS